MSDITTYAIKTGRVFTAVIVDGLRNQCAVPLSKWEPGGVHHLLVSGTGKGSISKAAVDGAGESFKTLAALLEEHPDAERRRDLDT